MVDHCSACFLAAGLLLSPAVGAETLIDFEDQQVPSGWTQVEGSASSWVVTDTAASSGSYSFRSGPINDSETAAVEWTGVFEGDTLSFEFRMVSEQSFDYFRLYIDGIEVYSASGTLAEWTEVRRPLSAGQHTLRWSYQKDGSVAIGDDAVWIDNVRVGQALPVAHPLLQEAGALLMSSRQGLVEMTFPEQQQWNQPTDLYTRLAFAADATLYSAVADSVRRYEPLSNTFVPFTSAVNLSGAMVVLPDRLLVGRSNSCGSYSAIFLASGNVFNSAAPPECMEDWRSVSRHGDDLIVLQGSEITRRSVAAPGTITSSVSMPFSAVDMAVAADGSLWLASSRTLHHVSPSGQNIASYPMSGTLDRVAIREDGLIAVFTGTDRRLGLIRPDHGFELWSSTTEHVDDIEFVPGVVTDSDGDGLPLWWEQAFGLDPDLASDAMDDLDSDGLSNLQEYQFRSSPSVTDTDGDGATDAVEHAAGSDPLLPDTDRDGLSDGIELIDLLSNPLLADSDGDGMDDLYEFSNGLAINTDDAGADADADGLSNLAESQRGTSPLIADSDGDGLADGAEVNLHGTDPLAEDSDGDLLLDGAEIDTHGTDALATDSDSDGLDDHMEIVDLGSNPNSIDTDGDGMPDAWEHSNSLDLVIDDSAVDVDNDGLPNLAEFTRGTLPTNSDSDGDMLVDGIEVTLGTDPLALDSDGDRMPDGWEFAFALDPLLADSSLDLDHDGFNALAEFWSDTAENDASDHPLPQPWVTHQGSARHNGYQPLAFRRSINRSPSLRIEVEGAFHTAIAGSGRIIYSQTSHFGSANRLVALDAQTGHEVWRRDFGQIFSTNPPAHADGRVYVQTGNHSGDTFLHAYDAASGELVFKAPHGAQWERYLAPTPFEGSVYVNGGTYGGAYAFDGTSGLQQWFAPLAQYDEWTPAVDREHIYAYTGGNLDVLDRNDGSHKLTIADPLFAWNGYSVDMAPMLGGFGNVVVCQAGHMTSFDVRGAAVAWTRPGCGGAPAVANGLVFSNTNGYLSAVDEIDGSTVWTKEFESPLSDNILVTRDYVIVSDTDQTYFVRIVDRSVARTLPVTGRKIITDDGRLIVSSERAIEVFDLPLVDPVRLIFFDDSFD